MSFIGQGISEIDINGTIKYQCPACLRTFSKKSSCSSHVSKCKLYLGEEKYNSYIEKTSKSHKGVPLDEYRRMKLQESRIGRVVSEETRKKISMSEKGKRVSEESRKKMSKSHKGVPLSDSHLRAILSSTPGRGCSSKFRNIRLKSTYEAIYACYLAYKGIEVKYEDIRVSYDGSRYLSDFRIDNHIVEIKGYYTPRCDKIKEAFEHAGYTIEILYWDELKPLIAEMESAGVLAMELYDKIYRVSRHEIGYLHWDYRDGKVIYLD